MNASTRFARLISLTALAVASAAAFAQSEPVERSRADVVNETLAARAAGTLAPAGELPAPWQLRSNSAPSKLTRSDVQSEVLAARAAGTLIPAGEDAYYAVAPTNAVSTVTRAEVKATVIAARKAGDLVPAGEGPDFETHARAKTVSNVRTAGAGVPATQMAKQ